MDLRKARDWLAGEFGPRGPYTEVRLDEDVARVLAQHAIAEQISLTEAARRVMERGLAA